MYCYVASSECGVARSERGGQQRNMVCTVEDGWVRCRCCEMQGEEKREKIRVVWQLMLPLTSGNPLRGW